VRAPDQPRHLPYAIQGRSSVSSVIFVVNALGIRVALRNHGIANAVITDMLAGTLVSHRHFE